MSHEVHAAYNAHQRTDETIRETEAHALLSCASRLEAARDSACPDDVFHDALNHNQELWTVLQSCLCEADNPLPRDLKTLLLNISCYVDKETFRALAENDRSGLRGLVSINRTLAAGLRQNNQPQQSTSMQQPTAQQYPSQQTSSQLTSHQTSTQTQQTPSQNTPHTPLMTSA